MNAQFSRDGESCFAFVGEYDKQQIGKRDPDI
jgi:hypothetical protein